MPDQHTHNDRGTLHTDCPACDVVAATLNEVFASDKVTRLFYDQPDEPTVHLNTPVTTGTATAASPLPLVRSLQGLSHRIGDTGMLALLAHMHLAHPCDTLNQIGPTVATLADAQSLHALLHLARIGHHDSEGAEHMVGPANLAKIDAEVRLQDQKALSAQRKAERHAEHVRRTVVAREQRVQARIDAARALKRAITHADGTIVPRLTLGDIGKVNVSVGFSRPITLAKVTTRYGARDYTGIGTALCRPGDLWAARIGEALALGRALRSLGHQIETFGLALDEEGLR